MALADYYSRGAVAAAQVLAGFDEALFRDVLEGTTVMVSFGADALSPEGDALTDLLVRLTARLYPALAFRGPDPRVLQLAELARTINPDIEIAGRPTVEILVGIDAPKPLASTAIYAGSASWDALISTTAPRAVGSSKLPFGAGAAACLAAANAFRATFLPAVPMLDADLTFSTFSGTSSPTPATVPAQAALTRPAVIAGCGAIGNAVVWALARSDLKGEVDLVDHEVLDLGNLQRYALAVRGDVGRPKVEIAAEFLAGALRGRPQTIALSDFLARSGYDQDRVLLTLDSARDRRQGQASLPRWIANAWTQPGDLGVSDHRFGNGACVNCMYLPDGVTPNEDEVVARALRVPERLMEIRTLLHSGQGVSRLLLDAIAAKLEVPIERLRPFEGRPVRALYVEGLCGGTVIPLGQGGIPAQDVHVPLAHQSALAGVLLAAVLMRDAAGAGPSETMVTRVNVMGPVGTELTRPAQADPRGICICQDPDYLARYAAKFGSSSAPARPA